VHHLVVIISLCYLSFVDKYSRWNLVYTLRHKGEVLELFGKWMKKMEKQTDRNIKVHSSHYRCILESSFNFSSMFSVK